MNTFPPIGDLIPHALGMRLIDRVISEEDSCVRAEAAIRSDGIFFQAGRGAPAYLGLEMMAQTICAYDGLRRHRSGKPPAIGFLLGCRRYRTARPFFLEGETLTIEVSALLGEEGLGSFQCAIADAAGADVANGVINVYRPPEGAIGDGR